MRHPAPRSRSSSSSSPTASPPSRARWARCCGARPCRPTSRSGSTSPAPCSTPTGAWWSTRRTSRCTSAPSGSACGGVRGGAADRAGRRGGHQPPGVRRLAPAGRHGRHAGSRDEAGRCSAAWRAAPTTPRSAARGPARCRPTPRGLAEEGVVIPPRYLVRGGEPRWEEMRRAARRGGPYPSRARRREPGRPRAPRWPPTTAAPRRCAAWRGEHGARARRGATWPALTRAGRASRCAPALARLAGGRSTRPRSGSTTARRSRVRARDRRRPRAVSTSPARRGVHPGNLNAHAGGRAQRRALRAAPARRRAAAAQRGPAARRSSSASRRACSTRRSPPTRRWRRPWSAATSRPASAWSTRCSRRWGSPPAARGR